jgi:D-alanyl-lipoteichoic acid acyltransferase DltB (MBOAT superfamily)
MSYTIDVYRKKVLPASNATEFFAFVSFFPQLVAGPIERAKNLLPQFSNKRVFNEKFAVEGLRQILWGLFKKIVIADNCATFSDQIFNNTESYSGSALIMGAIMFSFQMYGDFSGYSDIAIGTSKLFGFRLKRNFAFPYFARDIAEFWRRWHISLSSWFKDYLYFPLGGSRENKLISIRNTTIVFLVSGFWHGANWTFIFWGLLHALFYLPLLILNRNRKNTGDIAPNRTLPSLREFFGIIITFGLATFSRIFFRAEDLDHAFFFVKNIFTHDLFSLPIKPLGFNLFDYGITILLTMFMFVFEWFQRNNDHGLSSVPGNVFLRWTMYLALILSIFILGGDQQDFIYFQF